VDVALEDSYASLPTIRGIFRNWRRQYPAVAMAMHQSHYLAPRRDLIHSAITRNGHVCSWGRAPRGAGRCLTGVPADRLRMFGMKLAKDRGVPQSLKDAREGSRGAK